MAASYILDKERNQRGQIFEALGEAGHTNLDRTQTIEEVFVDGFPSADGAQGVLTDRHKRRLMASIAESIEVKASHEGDIHAGILVQTA